MYCSKRKKKRFCDHCDRLVSIRKFNAHKRRKTVDDANIDYTDELPSQDLPIQIQATWILTLCYQAMNVPKLQNLPPKVRNFKIHMFLEVMAVMGCQMLSHLTVYKERLMMRLNCSLKTYCHHLRMMILPLMRATLCRVIIYQY